MEMGNKALIITGKNVQDHEFIYPYYRLKEAGYEVTVAIRNAKNERTTTGILGTKIPCDDECEIIDTNQLSDPKKFKSFQVLVIPGGAKAMEYLRQETVILEFIDWWDYRKKDLFVICHAAQLLISAKIIKGRKVAGYYSIKDDIINAGGKYCSTYCKDGNIYSASHYKYMGEWMRWILK